MMKKKLKTVLLLDDNGATNTIHTKFITKVNFADEILKFQCAVKALAYLKSVTPLTPDLIFVDINMPNINGWEFLRKFEKMSDVEKKNSIVVLLSTSLSTEDREKAGKMKIIDKVRLKPLTVKAVQEIVTDFFLYNEPLKIA
ncbi:response regulator [Maribacter algarum]|nr:response regulator [Maribacter algarum]